MSPEFVRNSLSPVNPDIPRGGSLPVTVSIDRLEGFAGAVDVQLEGLPEGITATATRIGPESFNCIVTLTAAEQAPAPQGPGAYGLKVTGRAMIAGQPVERTTAAPFGGHLVTITSPPDLIVRVEPGVAQIQPGQDLQFTATIERRNGVSGRVPIEVLNLPHGLRVLDVGLNGVLITEGNTSRAFVVHCDPWAVPGPVEFFAAGKIEAKGNERHTSPPVRIEVQPGGVPAAGG